jgi:hypothetical protein
MRTDRIKYQLTTMENALRVFRPSTLVYLTDLPSLILHDGVTVGGSPVGSGGGTGDGVPEAPLDGQIYGRRGSDATWQPMSMSVQTPGTVAPNGNKIGGYKGQSYCQLASDSASILRNWIFNGTPGQNQGWL